MSPIATRSAPARRLVVDQFCRRLEHGPVARGTCAQAVVHVVEVDTERLVESAEQIEDLAVEWPGRRR